MDQQVRHAKDRIIIILTDDNIHDCTVFFHDNAMQCKRQRNPLIFLDAAIVMRIKVSQPAVLIERILLHIEAAGVDMRAKNRKTRLQRLCTDMKEHHSLFHADCIDLIASRQFFARFDDLRKIRIACSLSLFYSFQRAFPLSLAGCQKRTVMITKLLQLFFFRLGIRIPYRFFFLFCHNDHSISAIFLSISS